MGGSLDGKIAIVTGATNGIGRATARELTRLGARTLLVARDRARGESAAAEIRESCGGRVPEVLVADLSSQSEVRRLAPLWHGGILTLGDARAAPLGVD